MTDVKDRLLRQKSSPMVNKASRNRCEGKPPSRFQVGVIGNL